MIVGLVRRLRPVDRVGDAADAGLSLVEVMVAMIVFALVASAGTAMIVTGIGTTRLEKNKTVATGVAATALENLRSYANQAVAFDSTQPSQNILPPNGNTVTTQTVGGEVFTVTQTTQWVPKTAPAGSCDSTGQGGNSAVQPVLQATESVSWPAMKSAKPVTTTTTFTPPIADQTAGTGGIDLKVTDHANNPTAGIPITVTGPSTANIVSDSRGCAFAAYLAVGTYTVTLNSAGYVDNQENVSSKQTFQVTSGTVTAGTFIYDLASSLVTSFPTTPTPATGLPVTVYNSGLPVTGTDGPITSATPLFPYSSYNVWAGVCPEANPNAVLSTGLPMYATQPLTTVSMTAGQASSVVVPLYPLTVTVSSASNKPLSAVSFSAVETAYPQAKYPCTSTNTYPLLNPSGPGSTTTGMPLGYFTVKVSAIDNGVAVSNTASPTKVLVTPTGATASVVLP
jgi:prepilin-type N-terminal cleavage/methylation domain-containing protein